jgi:hypothetical protein
MSAMPRILEIEYHRACFIMSGPYPFVCLKKGGAMRKILGALMVASLLSIDGGQ